MRSFQSFLLFGGIFCVVSGCTTVDYGTPISKFTSGMATASGSLRGYYTSMNDFERDLYLNRALYDQTLNVAATTPDNRPTGLLPIFSESAMQARLEALTVLTEYGQALAALAGSDAPTRYAAASKTLGDNTQKLVATFDGLAKQKDPSALEYVGPLTALIGIFGQRHLEHERDTAIRKAVEAAKPQVDAILTQLSADMKNVVDPLIVTGWATDANNARIFYNANRTKLNLLERREILHAIDDSLSKYELATAADPAKQVAVVQDAYNSLIQYAKSPRKPKDLAELATALEAFNARLQPFTDAVVAMRERK